MNHKYEARQALRPKQLSGISEEQIAQHWTLYEGYVKNVNLLNEKLSALSEKKSFGPEFAEMKRRKDEARRDDQLWRIASGRPLT